MKKDLVRVGNTGGGNLLILSAAQFGALAEVPAELEWLGNVENLRTRRAYQIDLREFMTFTGLQHPTELRAVARVHVIDWRDALKGVRYRAILATLLYHGIRREELCGLTIRDMQSRQGVMHFTVSGKGDTDRFVPVHPSAQRLIEAYLTLAGHASDLAGPVFHPVTNNRTGMLEKPLYPGSIYHNIIRKYGRETGINAEVKGLCVHSLRATAATNALTHEADIANVQEWLGHVNVSTTRLYGRRKTRPEDSPTFRVRY